jgi:hypothetical protein
MGIEEAATMKIYWGLRKERLRVCKLRKKKRPFSKRLRNDSEAQCQEGAARLMRKE